MYWLTEASWQGVSVALRPPGEVSVTSKTFGFSLAGCVRADHHRTRSAPDTEGADGNMMP